MKKAFIPHTGRLAALAVALLASTLVLPAQPTPENRNPDQPIPRRPLAGGERPGGGVGGQFFLLVERVLTDEQRASFRTAMESQREPMRGIEGKLRDARRELMKAGVIEKFDEDDVRAKALEVAKLEAELTVLRAKAFSQIKPALSPDQIEQLKNPPVPELPPRAETPRRFERRESRLDPPQRPQRQGAGPRDGNDLPPRPE